MRVRPVILPFALAATLMFVASVQARPAKPSKKDHARAAAVLDATPLIDGHNDLPWQYRKRVKNKLAEIDLHGDQSGLAPSLHSDIARMRQGKLGGQFWSVYVPVELETHEAVTATLEQIDVVHRLIAAYPKDLALALTADDIVRIHKEGKIASLVGMEGGHSIGNSLGALRMMYRLGARYMTLTHWQPHDWADSATGPPIHNGLTDFGRAVIAEMNRLGMLIDLSHVSAKVMHDVLDVSTAPVIFSHSSAFSLCRHPRNVPDAVLKRVKSSGGVVMVTFVTGFINCKIRRHWAEAKAARARLESLHPGDPKRAEASYEAWKKANPTPKATLSDAADHIDHIRKVAGIDAVGIGSDFDGIENTPVGLHDTAAYPALFAELARRGYDDASLAKIAGGNVLRAMRAVEAKAAALQTTEAPGEMWYVPAPATEK